MQSRFHQEPMQGNLSSQENMPEIRFGLKIIGDTGCLFFKARAVPDSIKSQLGIYGGNDSTQNLLLLRLNSESTAATTQLGIYGGYVSTRNVLLLRLNSESNCFYDS